MDLPRRFYVIVLLMGFIAWALAVHIDFVLSVPDPVFSPDSMGYALPGLDRLTGHALDLTSAGRTPIYPLFIYASLKLLGTFTGVLALQHMLALFTAFGAAVLYYRRISPSLMSAALVFFVTSALPIPSIYAHAILTETLYTFFLVATLIFLFKSLEKALPLNGFIMGIFLSLAILTRPVGYALWVAVAVVIGCSRKPQAIQCFLSGCLGAGAVVLFLYAAGFSGSSFFGVNHQSGMALFGTSARYLEINEITDLKAKKILQPFYEQDAQRFSDFNWVCHSPGGPMRTLSLAYSPTELDILLKRLSFQAIRAKPFQFLSGQAGLIGDFFLSYSAIPQIYMNREYTFFIYRGLLIYGKAAHPHPGILAFLRHTPEEAHFYFSQIHALAGKSDVEAQEKLNRVNQQDVYHYDNVLRWWIPIKIFLNELRWLPCLALLFSCLLGKTNPLRCSIFTFWIVIGLHAALSAFSGVEPRYAVPITPLYWILFIAGCEAVIQWIYNIRRT